MNCTTQVFRAGIDIGSTTVKLVLLDDAGSIVYSNYCRHRAHTQETLLDLLRDVRRRFPSCLLSISMTGSGALSLADALGAPLCRKWQPWRPPSRRQPRRRT